MSVAEQATWLHEGQVAYTVFGPDAFGTWHVQRQGFRLGEDQPWYTLLLALVSSEKDARECVKALTTEHTAHRNGIGLHLRPEQP